MASSPAESGPARVLVVGAGFAGYEAARRLARTGRGRVEVTLLNPADFFLYLPLLPEVAAGILEPRHVAVPLARLPGVRLVLGKATRVDRAARRVAYVDPEDREGTLPYDRLVVCVGSVNKLLPIPGVAGNAHGFRGVAEALYLRDHLVRQLEIAGNTADERLRRARCTFVVVGAGYTGVEVAAAGQLFTRSLARRRGGLTPHWLLLDLAERVLPELNPRLSEAADKVLRRRGVEVCVKTSVQEATPDGVHLTDGRFVPSRSLIWCVGVRPDPFVEHLGLPTVQGRLDVDEYLTMRGHPEVTACGDAAAVPDLTRPGQLTPMTAQHAVRQGRVAAHNVAASLGYGTRRAYRHHDLGFLVDLGGTQATCDPLGVPLSGLPAKAVTRAYHLLSLPGNRGRVAADWLLDPLLGRQRVQLGLVRSRAVPLETAAPQ